MPHIHHLLQGVADSKYEFRRSISQNPLPVSIKISHS
jgi:hypothetical protein